MTIFTTPSWAPAIPSIPDDIPISEFILNAKYGREDPNTVPPPFVCGISGKNYSFAQMKERVGLLARAMKKEFGEEDINAGSENDGFSQWSKVAAIFSPNCIDYSTVAWAIQNINGIVSPANQTYTASELAYQLKDAKARILFTSAPVLETALSAAKEAGIPRDKVFVLDMAPNMITDKTKQLASGFKTMNQLVEEGKSLKEVEPLKWSRGFGKKKLAFLCYSSGTSGLPKGVLIAHHNVISNVLSISSFYGTYRRWKDHSVVCGAIPMSHIYSMVVINHTEVYNGGSVIVIPKFELQQFLASIEKFRMEYLYLVPPIIIALVKNKALVEKYDFSSVRNIFTGAAPFSEETSNEAAHLFPKLTITQAYGMTECSTVVSMTSTDDIWHGSSGCIVPEVQCKIISPEGKELGEGEIGELCIKGPNVTLGYLNNAKATAETFQDGWLRSGDEACFKRSKKGNMHLFVVDRLKDLVKVNGMQVAPAELEGHILNHPSVADVAVIGIPDEKAGEVPKACVVLKLGVPPNEKTIEDIKKFVADHKARHKHLGGGISFIDAIPRNPSGKILRRMLRDAEKEKRRKEGAKL